MKYVFFGTPNFAARVLDGLINGGNPPSVLVCNPDKPVGRKKIITPPPTKQLILNREVPMKIFQPGSVKELSDLSDELFRECDFGVVAAYGQIIPRKVIDSARLGIIGVHPSILPKLRGASPIQGAILEGYEETGVSLFMLDEEVDHGPVLVQREISVGDYNYAKLEKRLADVGVELLLDTLPRFVTEKTELAAQNESEATYTAKYSASDGYVEPDELKTAETNGASAVDISRKIRALNPEPGVYTVIDGKRTKLLGAELIDGKLKLTEIQKEGGLPRKL